MTRLLADLNREFAKSGFVNLGIGTFGNILLFSRHPLHTIDDLRKERFWSYDLDVMVESMLKQMGMKVVPMPLTSALTAYEQNQVDGFISVPSAALAFQWSAWSKYFSDLTVGTLPGCFVIAQRSFDALSIDQQRAVTAAVGKFIGRFDALGNLQDDALLGKLFMRQGLKRISADERLPAAFFEAAESAREKLPATLLPKELLGRTQMWLADFRARGIR